ncbi:MAG: hypothetical protein AB1489_08740 [Acidobacteriota bacterium]
MEKTAQLIGILDSEDENKRLELVIENAEVPRLALRLATYAEGLGWHTQKTIHIEAQQIEQLQFLLGGARHLLKQSVSAHETAAAATAPPVRKLIKFSPPTRKSA